MSKTNLGLSAAFAAFVIVLCPARPATAMPAQTSTGTETGQVQQIHYRGRRFSRFRGFRRRGFGRRRFRRSRGFRRHHFSRRGFRRRGYGYGGYYDPYFYRYRYGHRYW